MKKIFLLFAGAILFAAPAFAQTSFWRIDPRMSDVTFTLSSTLHDVTGRVHEFAGTMSMETDPSSVKGDGVFMISAMDTGNKVRDGKMRKMFDVEHYPNIVYQFEMDELPQEGSVELHGWMTIKDVKRPHPMSVQVVRTADSVTMTGFTDVSLKDYHLQAPGVMGVIKVDDVIRVNFKMAYQLQK